jgi:hypothetical protein
MLIVGLTLLTVGVIAMITITIYSLVNDHRLHRENEVMRKIMAQRVNSLILVMVQADPLEDMPEVLQQELLDRIAIYRTYC